MIERRVDAVFLLRDAFSGRTITDGAGTACLLDGMPLRRPIWKKEGYLVLTDLAPGEHELLLRRRGYRDETVTLRAGDGPLEDTVSLKPGAGYRFPSRTVSALITLKRGKDAAADGQLWLGVSPRSRLKLAQDKTEPGDAEARLFCEGSASLLPVPGHFLLLDKKTPELAYLRSLRGEDADFAPPLQASHARGTELVPMQCYAADENGAVRVLLPSPGHLIGFSGGSVFEAELHEGEQTLEWKLGG